MRIATGVDYQCWRNKEEWTVKEASCLLAGLVPPPSTEHDSWEKIGFRDPRQRFIDETKDMWRSDWNEDSSKSPFPPSPELEEKIAQAKAIIDLIEIRTEDGQLQLSGVALPPADWEESHDPHESFWDSSLPPADWEELIKQNSILPSSMNSQPVAEQYTQTTTRHEARKLTTQTMHESWQKGYRKLKKANPGKSDKWCSLRIAEMDIAQGRKAETIRKNMKS